MLESTRTSRRTCKNLRFSGTQILFSQTFRAPPGYPGKNPGISRPKVWFPWVAKDMPSFLAPTHSRGRPPPHWKMSGPKNLGLCSFFLPDIYPPPTLHPVVLGHPTGVLTKWPSPRTLPSGSRKGTQQFSIAILLTIHRGRLGLSAQSAEKISKRVPGPLTPLGVHSTLKGVFIEKGPCFHGQGASPPPPPNFPVNTPQPLAPSPRCEAPLP